MEIVTPFDDVPNTGFIFRLIGVALAMGVVAALGVGVASHFPPFQYVEFQDESPSFARAPYLFYQRLGSTLNFLPQICWKEVTIDEFQKTQCVDFWNLLVYRAGLGAVPFGVVLLVFLWGYSSLYGFFSRAKRKAKKGKADYGGVVTNPPETFRGLFGWLYGFRAVMIQLPNKTQVKVYVSLELSAPVPGQTLVAFNISRGFWEKRYLAMVYAPHVAVVRGS